MVLEFIWGIIKLSKELSNIIDNLFDNNRSNLIEGLINWTQSDNHVSQYMKSQSAFD